MAETSTQQMALLRDWAPGGFMERVMGMLSFVTPTILSEPGSTAYHQSRAFHAQKVVQNPRQMAEQGGPQIVMGVNVVNATTYNEEEKTAVCTITDLDLQSQILSLWNSLAGIDTPS